LVAARHVAEAACRMIEYRRERAAVR